jgi:DNA-binding MarR family transcriptional regulator
MNQRAKDYNLSSGLFFYMMELGAEDGLTLQQLSQAVSVDNGLTTRSVKKLVELGYVNKVQNPLDSRSSQVFLTEAGREVAKSINQIFLEWKTIVTKGVSEKELSKVNQIFDQFYENAKSAIES